MPKGLEDRTVRSNVHAFLATKFAVKILEFKTQEAALHNIFIQFIRQMTMNKHSSKIPIIAIWYILTYIKDTL